MAQPIRLGMVLQGKDAEVFCRQIENAKFNPVRARQIEEARQLYRFLKRNGQIKSVPSFLQRSVTRDD